jgi:hypothetical protein
MRGIPYFNFPAFDKATAELRAAGYEVWSPAEHDREVYGPHFEQAYPTGVEDSNFDLRAALGADTAKICEWADGIALLPGWRDSKGALAEMHLARALDVPIKEVEKWVADAPIPYELTDKGRGVSETLRDPQYWASKSMVIADTWAYERDDILNRFTEELRKATGDGSKKRQAGAKPPWWADDSHFGAVLSHLTKWVRGEQKDPDSGAHPLVHAAWRCLAIACKESGNTPVPKLEDILKGLAG